MNVFWQASLDKTASGFDHFAGMLLGYVSRFSLQSAHQFVVTSKVQCGNQCSGQHFGIAHAALAVFMMIDAFQKVVTKVKKYSNLIVHGHLPVKLLVGNFQLYRDGRGLSSRLLKVASWAL
jgi:hypothetical protein